MNEMRPMFVAACALLFLGCQEGLYHELDEQSANELVVALHEAGIDAQKVDESRRGYAVEVPRGTAVRAMNALEARGLPRPKVEGFAAAFGSDGIVPSPVEERARLQYATAQEVRRSLLSIDGVADAHVNLVLPERRGREPATGTRASVVLRWSGDSPPVSSVDVQRVVSGGVEGLETSAVEVLMTEAATRTEHAPPTLVTVWPLTVDAAAKSTTQGILAVFSGAILLLGALLVTLVIRGRRPTRGLT